MSVVGTKPSDVTAEMIAAVRRSDEVREELEQDDTTPTTDLNVMRKRKARAVMRTEALALRLAGLSYSQIGERIGATESQAFDMVSRLLERADNRMAAQMRSEENARLDRAQVAIWAQVVAGDVKAVDVFLRLSARRSKLNGLDAPTAIKLNVNIRQEMETALVSLEQLVLGQVIPGETEDDDT